jgi:hypothetical protein
MANRDKSEKPSYVRDRESKRICYVENNFPNYKAIGKILQWLDRSFDLIPIKEAEQATVAELNQAIDKSLKLARSLESARGRSE